MIHLPIYIIKIISVDELDNLIDITTKKLEAVNPKRQTREYLDLVKASLILLDEYEQRLAFLYGADMGQVGRLDK